MKRLDWIRITMIGLTILVTGARAALANCQAGPPGFAVYQCANEAGFDSVPFPLTIDPNGRPTSMTVVFWQIGFGNATVNTGTGANGTGVIGGVFNGNDNGLWPVDLAGLSIATGDVRPVSGLCLRSNNWVNSGVDGCCENQRDAGASGLNNVLNPYFDEYYYSVGYPGVYSRASLQDYPMAVLLKHDAGDYFAFAAVASMKRDNQGGNGSCLTFPHAGNPAACDMRPGFFDFSDVSNGLANPNVAGKNNIVPWQSVPVPQGASVSCANPGAVNTPSVLSANLTWDGVETYTDQSIRPSANATMGGSLHASGVGVSDIIAKFAGLVRYDIEKAQGPGFASPTLLTEIFENPSRLDSDPNPNSSVLLAVDECARLTTLFGKKPQTAIQDPNTCRLGECGDIGYQVGSNWVCFGSDPDGDKIDDSVCADNCPGVYNPDQLDSDVDGLGDLCDRCPADPDPNSNCSPAKSTALSMGTAGGSMTTPDGTVSFSVPAGALSNQTSMSITSIGTGADFEVGDGTYAVTVVVVGKSGVTFSPQATITFHWTDLVSPGTVDGPSGILESDLRIFEDGNDISGPCSSPNAGATCDTMADTFSVPVSHLSRFVLGVTIVSAGTVPDGDTVPGPPLMATRQPNGDLTLSWSPSCSSLDTDYGVYEGDLRQFASHVPRSCSTGGATSMTFTPGTGNQYYLVVPRTAIREGSLGPKSNGSQRPRGPSPCLPRAVITCQ